MITIDYPSLHTQGNTTTISYPIVHDGQPSRALSFTVDSRFRDFLNPGRADGALVALLPWISRRGGKVRVLPSLSPQLVHFGIRLFSHILTGIGPFLKPVELTGEVHAEALCSPSGSRIGAGGSLGVDSLCIIAELEKAGTPVTHLFHNNCGSHWGNRELLEGRRKISRHFAEKNGMEFVWMDSSLHDFYGNEGYLNWFPFLDSGSVLVLNGLMNSYWTSATYHITHPDFTTRNRQDYYEFHLHPYIFSAAETEQARFHLHGLDLARYEKTSILADYPPAYGSLNVCLERPFNCGACLKCRRTISQLYLLGHLQKFSGVFNLKAFQDKPLRFLAKTIVHSGHFQQEILHLLKHSTVLSPSEKRQVWFHCMRKQPFLPFRHFQ